MNRIVIICDNTKHIQTLHETNYIGPQQVNRIAYMVWCMVLEEPRISQTI